VTWVIVARCCGVFELTVVVHRILQAQYRCGFRVIARVEQRGSLPGTPMNPEREANGTNCRGNAEGWRPNALHPIAERHFGDELVEFSRHLGAIASVIA
jgi:hypothetical protein